MYIEGGKRWQLLLAYRVWYDGGGGVGRRSAACVTAADELAHGMPYQSERVAPIICYYS